MSCLSSSSVPCKQYLTNEVREKSYFLKTPFGSWSTSSNVPAFLKAYCWETCGASNYTSLIKMALLVSETLLKILPDSITSMIYLTKAIAFNKLAPPAHSKYLKTCRDQDEGLSSSCANMQPWCAVKETRFPLFLAGVTHSILLWGNSFWFPED